MPDTETRSLDLSYSLIDAKPVSYDWSADGWPERWDWIKLIECSHCDTICPSEGTEVWLTRPQIETHGLDESDGLELDDDHEGSGHVGSIEVEANCCPNPECPDFREEQEEDLDGGPMMNYYYPLDERPPYGSPWSSWEEAAEAIANLPLVIVRLEEDEEYALALSGGGMDLSWEICEAYMRLGYFPPVHFELPGMAGKPGDADDLWVIDGVAESARAMAQQAQRRAERALEMLLKGPALSLFIDYDAPKRDDWHVTRVCVGPERYGRSEERDVVVSVERIEEIGIELPVGSTAVYDALYQGYLQHDGDRAVEEQRKIILHEIVERANRKALAEGR